eukprot:9475717-Prorocentrum_lima.AAC.1
MKTTGHGKPQSIFSTEAKSMVYGSLRACSRNHECMTPSVSPVSTTTYRTWRYQEIALGIG